MRRLVWITATAAILVFPARALCQQPDQPQGEHAAQPPAPNTLEEKKDTPKPSPAAAASQGQSQSPAATSATGNPPKESLADAARRSRELKKDAGKSGKIFTNDNLPSEGGVSTVGVATTAVAEDDKTGDSSEHAERHDEKTWRERFAKLRDKLAKDQADLDILQRELGVVDLQAYNDPMKALQQNLTRSDINAKTAKIDQMTKQVEADKQAIADAEDELRRSGGDVGWAR